MPAARCGAAEPRNKANLADTGTLPLGSVAQTNIGDTDTRPNPSSGAMPLKHRDLSGIAPPLSCQTVDIAQHLQNSRTEFGRPWAATSRIRWISGQIWPSASIAQIWATLDMGWTDCHKCRPNLRGIGPIWLRMDRIRAPPQGIRYAAEDGARCSVAWGVLVRQSASRLLAVDFFCSIRTLYSTQWFR